MKNRHLKQKILDARGFFICPFPFWHIFSNLLSVEDLLELQIVRNFLRENEREFSIDGLPPPPPPEKFVLESLGKTQTPDQRTRTSAPLFKDLSFDVDINDYWQ